MTDACVYYMLYASSGAISMCGDIAPYKYQGSSYCAHHIERALRGQTWQVNS